jgi:hypothetical protein
MAGSNQFKKIYNRRKLYLLNIPNEKTKDSVWRYSYHLTNQKPTNLQMVEKRIGKWLVEFDTDLGIFIVFEYFFKDRQESLKVFFYLFMSL